MFLFFKHLFNFKRKEEKKIVTYSFNLVAFSENPGRIWGQKSVKLLFRFVAICCYKENFNCPLPNFNLIKTEVCITKTYVNLKSLGRILRKDLTKCYFSQDLFNFLRKRIISVIDKNLNLYFDGAR
jgi:hypothetical protein